MKVVLITGASGGIGEAIVNRLAERKLNLPIAFCTAFRNPAS